MIDSISTTKLQKINIKQVKIRNFSILFRQKAVSQGNWRAKNRCVRIPMILTHL